MDLQTLYAVEETTDFLADLVTDGLVQADPLFHRPHVREFIRQELAMAVTDAQQSVLQLPECVTDEAGE